MSEQGQTATEQGDCVVRCKACGREEPASFSYHLRHGWPTCCGATMTVEQIAEGAIEAGVSDAFGPVRAALKGRRS